MSDKTALLSSATEQLRRLLAWCQREGTSADLNEVSLVLRTYLKKLHALEDSVSSKLRWNESIEDSVEECIAIQSPVAAAPRQYMPAQAASTRTAAEYEALTVAPPGQVSIAAMEGVLTSALAVTPANVSDQAGSKCEDVHQLATAPLDIHVNQLSIASHGIQLPSDRVTVTYTSITSNTNNINASTSSRRNSSSSSSTSDQ
eukprot:scpid94938/ scgid22425/ 